MTFPFSGMWHQEQMDAITLGKMRGVIPLYTCSIVGPFYQVSGRSLESFWYKN